MKQIVIDDHIYLIGKASEVFMEMAFTAALSKYNIGWQHQVSENDFNWN